MEFFAQIFAGAFLCNCIPHLVCGLIGEPFPSPFARPPGFGNSPPVVNVLWGFANLLAGIALLATHPVTIAITPAFVTLVAGGLLMGISLSWHFGRVRAARKAQS